MRRLYVALWVLLLVALGLLLITELRAGDVNFTWDPSAGAAGYRVYIGTESGIYGPPVVTAAPPLNVPNLPDCVEHFAAVTAYNIAGESNYTAEVAFWPRPNITNAAPSTVNPQIVFVDGTGFSTQVTLKLNGNVIPFVRDNCGRLSVNTVDVPGAPAWTLLEACNPGGLAGICSSHVPVVPADINGFDAS
jgi:hypothetical protein